MASGNSGLRKVIELIEAINPELYSQTRNYTNGVVTGLSPYISRGVISTRYVFEQLLERYDYQSCRKLIQELLWRDYFQRLQQHNQELHTKAIKIDCQGFTRKGIPLAILHGKTGIEAVDEAISNLYLTGRMHNHMRLYVASLCCSVGQCHFSIPGQWLYYHLLDADVASNFGSWQWVSGNITGKAYYANQENINLFTNVIQHDTIIDMPYEELKTIQIPEKLHEICIPELETIFPETMDPVITNNTVLLYTLYNMDPLWHEDFEADRILVLEPGHFKKFPIGENLVRFILSIAVGIKGIQLYRGELNDLVKKYPYVDFVAKEHPLFRHWNVRFDSRDWIVPEITGFYSSFSKYYNECEKKITQYG
ncbi:FAD-binding domain-containing protein [Flavobacterium pallidum]|uniref:Deoxyribodipyrimidine photolyase n=1 Tax=Flavobacterium pallidum TaxID=2172098 RepID=A0A2S1SK08_9FLAO|nr:FAD-binding domain-containing protein [Flavobacterium pallidum]AWI26754.1 deoxyribodipyrimidine photolyase [Flavobacterium pallidum]